MSRLLRQASLAAVVATRLASAGENPVGGDYLKLIDPPADSAKRHGVFRALRDTAIAPSPANDPRVLGATVEIAGLGGGDGTTGTILLAPELWKGLGSPEGSRGFKYVDPAAATGVKKVLFAPGPNGGKLVVVGHGSAWPYAVEHPQSAVAVRFAVGSDLYCALFTGFKKNEPGRLRAVGAPAPVSCAPLVCGNGLAEALEECDDGNAVDGDGCSATCQLEDASALCAGVATTSGTGLRAVRIATGLASPVDIAAPRLDPSRLFVVEQPGRIRIIKNDTLLAAAFLAIEGKVQAGGEKGLLGLAFHPNYENNGRFFVNYLNNDGDTVIARYQVSAADPDQADAASEKIVLTIAQPYSNHNGGGLAFGPDGYLYAGMGDGGSGGDPLELAQDEGSLLGKMLRIEVDVEAPPYRAVPPTNPNAAAGDPLGLIWAKGLRNPWRFSFDRASGALFIGDVGQGDWEEINYRPAGGPGGENYGWDVFEGSHCYEPEPPATECPSPPAGFTMPVHEYDHVWWACSVTGGYVYRGCRMPDLRGVYFYGDYCAGFVRTFEVSGGIAVNHGDRTAEIDPGGGQHISLVVTFGEDARGELYIADHADGEVYRLVPEL